MSSSSNTEATSSSQAPSTSENKAETQVKQSKQKKNKTGKGASSTAADQASKKRKPATALKQAKKAKKVSKQRGVLEGITKPAIKRLERRAAIRRASAEVAPEIRKYVDETLNNIIQDGLEYTKLGGRKTLAAKDILAVLPNHGNALAFTF